MNASLLIQTVVSGLLASAAIVVFLVRFGRHDARWPQVVAAAVFLDQASKWVVIRLIAGGAPHPYLGGNIEVGYYTNYLQGFGGASPWLLGATLVAGVAAIRLYQMLIERRYVMSSVTECGLALILGAVAATAMERAWSGFVVDFLQFGAQANYVYNFADLSAFAGMAVLLIRAAVVLPPLVERELAAAGAGGNTR